MFFVIIAPVADKDLVFLHPENERDQMMSTTITLILPLDETTVLQDGDFCVMDNLEQLFGLSDEKQGTGLPMKLSLSSMIIIIEGKVRIKANFSDCELTAGSCVVIMPGTIVERIVMGVGTRAIAIHCPATDAYYQQVTQYQLATQHLDMLLGVYRLLRKTLIDDTLNDGKPAVAARCVGLMAAIMEHGTIRPDIQEKRTRGDEIVSNFMQCVADNYREHRDVGFYAAQLGLTLKYMSHVIYGSTGRHPSQWIKDYVILDAKTMLRSGRYSVQQVADALHFPNQSFFGKYFKEAVGVSPKKWK